MKTYESQNKEFIKGKNILMKTDNQPEAYDGICPQLHPG